MSSTTNPYRPPMRRFRSKTESPVIPNLRRRPVSSLNVRRKGSVRTGLPSTYRPVSGSIGGLGCSSAAGTPDSTVTVCVDTESKYRFTSIPRACQRLTSAINSRTITPASSPATRALLSTSPRPARHSRRPIRIPKIAVVSSSEKSARFSSRTGTPIRIRKSRISPVMKPALKPSRSASDQPCNRFCNMA